MRMNKNLSVRFSVAAFVALALVAVPAYLLFNKECEEVVRGDAVARESFVTAMVSVDTLTAVSGIEKPLYIEVANDGDEPYEGGAIIVSIYKERSGSGDAALAARYVAKRDVDLAPQSSAEHTYMWSIPSSLPSGAYRVEAAYSYDGAELEDYTVRTRDPFGNDAKLVISGDVSSLSFEEPIVYERESGYEAPADCADRELVFALAAAIGGLGVAMLIIARRRDKRANP